MPLIELKQGKERSSIMDIPPGCTIAHIAFLSMPVTYRGPCTMYLHDQVTDRGTEFVISGSHTVINVNGFNQFYFEAEGPMNREDFVRFDFWLSDGTGEDSPGPGDLVAESQDIRSFLLDAISTGEPVRIIPEVVDGVPWVQEYSGKRYQIASLINGTGANFPFCLLIDPTNRRGEITAKIDRITGIALKLYNPDLTKAPGVGFLWIITPSTKK